MAKNKKVIVRGDTVMARSLPAPVRGRGRARGCGRGRGSVMYLSDIKSCVALGTPRTSIGAQVFTVGAQVFTVGAQVLTIGTQNAPACYELCVK